MVGPRGEVVLEDRPLAAGRVNLAGLSPGLDLAHGECPQGVRSQYVLPEEGDDDVPVGLGSRVRPVEVALGLPALEEVGDHHDHVGVLLPDHAPERVESALDGTLGRERSCYR